MKIPPTDTPALTDASAKEATGKTLKQWFTELGKLGAKNRREMTQYLYSDCKLPEWWAVTLVVEYEKASGQQEKDGKPKGYSICATKTIAAPLGDVFAAFGEQRNDGSVEPVDIGAHLLKAHTLDRHCTLAPTCLITAVHFSVSPRMKVLNSEGLPATTS